MKFSTRNADEFDFTRKFFDKKHTEVQKIELFLIFEYFLTKFNSSEKTYTSLSTMAQYTFSKYFLKFYCQIYNCILEVINSILQNSKSNKKQEVTPWYHGFVKYLLKSYIYFSLKRQRICYIGACFKIYSFSGQFQDKSSFKMQESHL